MKRSVHKATIGCGSRSFQFFLDEHASHPDGWALKVDQKLRTVPPELQQFVIPARLLPAFCSHLGKALQEITEARKKNPVA